MNCRVEVMGLVWCGYELWMC